MQSFVCEKKKYRSITGAVQETAFLVIPGFDSFIF